MKKIKILVVEDEVLAREVIKKYLLGKENFEIIGECGNGFEGLKIISDEKPDIVFLDIQMPKINGFEMLELLDEPPVIIFTTAFDQYALKAFEVNAADYLLKPFSLERFDEALAKATILLKEKNKQTEIIKNLIAHHNNLNEYLERIVIKDGSKINIIPINEIKWIEAQDDYAMICTFSGKYLKQKTMKYFEDHLDPKEFVRIHRSFIASLKLIKKIELLEKESYQVTLDDKTTLPMSKNGYDRLKKIIK